MKSPIRPICLYIMKHSVPVSPLTFHVVLYQNRKTPVYEKKKDCRHEKRGEHNMYFM